MPEAAAVALPVRILYVHSVPSRESLSYAILRARHSSSALALRAKLCHSKLSLRYQRLRALLSIRNALALRSARLPGAISMEEAHPAEFGRPDAARMRALQLDSAMSYAEFANMGALVTALVLAARARATAMQSAKRRCVLVSSLSRLLATWC
jgi:hypothetical protein